MSNDSSSAYSQRQPFERENSDDSPVVRPTRDSQISSYAILAGSQSGLTMSGDRQGESTDSLNINPMFSSSNSLGDLTSHWGAGTQDAWSGGSNGFQHSSESNSAEGDISKLTQDFRTYLNDMASSLQSQDSSSALQESLAQLGSSVSALGQELETLGQQLQAQAIGNPGSVDGSQQTSGTAGTSDGCGAISTNPNTGSTGESSTASGGISTSGGCGAVISNPITSTSGGCGAVISNPITSTSGGCGAVISNPITSTSGGCGAVISNPITSTSGGCGAVISNPITSTSGGCGAVIGNSATGTNTGDGTTSAQSTGATIPNGSFVVTETGNYTSAGCGGISDQAQANYNTNALFTEYADGAKQMDLYELGDDPNYSGMEGSFGQFNSNGTPKLAATTEHNINEILGDPNSVPGSATTDFNYSISGMPSTADSLALQKSNGDNDLVIWNNVNSANGDPPPTQITLDMPSLAGQTVTYYDPEQSSGCGLNAQPVGQSMTVGANGELTVSLPDHPIIIQTPPTPGDTTGTTQPVSDFTSAEGVNTHLDFGGEYYGNTQQVIDDINFMQGGPNSGVHLTLRDSPDSTSDLQTWAEVSAATGDKFDAFLNESNQQGWANNLSLVQQMGPSIISSVEGPNEADDSYAMQQLGTSSPTQALQDAAAEMPAVEQVGQELGVPVFNFTVGNLSDNGVAQTQDPDVDPNSHIYYGSGSPPGLIYPVAGSNGVSSTADGGQYEAGIMQLSEENIS